MSEGTATDVRTSDVKVERDPNIGHIWCCVNENVGLCGDVLDQPADAETQDCVVCADLEMNDYDYCPVLGRCIE